METKPQIKFSLLEKLEFYNDPELKSFREIFPKVRKEDIRPFVEFAVGELEGHLPAEVDSWSWEGFPPEGLAVRKLVQILHREGAFSDREEVMEYLVSVNLPKPCCEELIATILPRDVFNNIPKSIRLRPILVSVQWKVDISFCQRDPQHFADMTTKVSSFHRRARVLLFLGFWSGAKSVLSVSPAALSAMRNEVARAITSCADVERRSVQPVRLTEEEREALEERGESIQGAI